MPKKIQIRWYVGNPVKEMVIGHIEDNKFTFKSKKIKEMCLEQLKEMSKFLNCESATLNLRNIDLLKNKAFLKHAGFLYAYTSVGTPSNPNLIALTYSR